MNPAELAKCQQEECAATVSQYLNNKIVDASFAQNADARVEQAHDLSGTGNSTFIVSAQIGIANGTLYDLKTSLQSTLGDIARFTVLDNDVPRQRTFFTLSGVPPRMSAAIFRNDRKHYPMPQITGGNIVDFRGRLASHSPSGAIQR